MATPQSNLPAGVPAVPACFGGAQPRTSQARRPRDTHVSELHQALLAQRAQTLVGCARLQEELRQAHALTAEERAHGGAASLSLHDPRTRTMGLPSAATAATAQQPPQPPATSRPPPQPVPVPPWGTAHHRMTNERPESWQSVTTDQPIGAQEAGFPNWVTPARLLEFVVSVVRWVWVDNQTGLKFHNPPASAFPGSGL